MLELQIAGGGAFVRGRVLEELTFPFPGVGYSLCDACLSQGRKEGSI